MTDLKARIGPKHDPQASFKNKVWVNPALANSPLSRARTTNHSEASHENHTPPPHSGKLSLIDRLNISPEPNEINENDSIKYTEEGQAKSLLGRVQSKKRDRTPMHAPNGRHLTPNPTIAETSSGSSDGRAFTKNKQDVTASTSTVNEGAHDDARGPASSPLPYMNGFHVNARPILASPGAAPSQNRDTSSSATSARSTPQLTTQASLNSFVERHSPATPAQATFSSQASRRADLQEPALAQPRTTGPSGVEETCRQDPLIHIRDRVFPLVQKNASARASVNAGHAPPHTASPLIDYTKVSDERVLTFARRSSEVSRELLAHGISALPPKPTQMPDTVPAGRSVDPVRRISKDFSNDNPISLRTAHSHSRHGFTEDRRMTTRSPPPVSSHSQRESVDSSRRIVRSPPPPRRRDSATGSLSRSRSPASYQRTLPEENRRYAKPPTERFSNENPSSLRYKSPLRNPERSASPQRRTSFASRLDHERPPERLSSHGNDGALSHSDTHTEERPCHNARPRSESRGAGLSRARMDAPPLPHSRSNQSFQLARRDPTRSAHSPSRSSWQRRSNSPYVGRRSASPARHYRADSAVNVGPRHPSSAHPPDVPQDSMRTTPITTSLNPPETCTPAESPNPSTNHQPGLTEDTRHPNTPNNTPPGDPLPCHNVPGIWFAECGQPSMSTKLCTFQIDGYTAQRWNIRSPESQSQEHNAADKLFLRLCCIGKKQFEECVASVVNLPDSSPRQVASAVFSLEKQWPLQGKLIITLNPDTPYKHVWLPHQIGPDYVSIQDFVREGQNIIQLVQLSGLSDFVFVLYATDDSGPTDRNLEPRPLFQDRLSVTDGTVTVTHYD